MSAAGWMLGTNLAPDDRRHVLDSYVHRMTTETRALYPDFAARMIRDGYRMPEHTDAEWLAATRFAVRKDCRLDKRVKRCETTYAVRA